MKNLLARIPYSSLLLAIATLFVANVGHAQVTLIVSPSVVSNTYPGVITLNVSGLNSGEKIYIGKYLDLNGNGAIDAGEPLMDAFPLVDNDDSYAVVGGATNINMPFDTNPANGVISAGFSIPSAMPLENMAGNYIIEVISPKGRFAPVTATFSITNAALPALITGTIYQGDGITPFPNAVVAAQDLVHNNVANASVADSNGHYSIAVYPGEYACVGAAMNCYYDQKTATAFYLTNGVSVTNSLTITNAGPYTISGKVYDEGNSNGIAGLLVQLQSGNLFEVAFTDTNGIYSAAVSPGFWKVQPAKERLARGGYVDPQQTYQADASTGSVTNFNIGYPQGDALIYGRVTDNMGNPIVGVKMDGNQNQATNYDSKGYTDINGNYAVAVMDGTNSCNVDTPTFGSPALNFIWNQPDETNILAGAAIREDFVGQPIIGTISGHVQSNTGTNIVGVGLYASTTIDGLNYSSLEGTTDPSGNYTLAVAAGTWNVYFLVGGFSDNLDAAGYEDLNAPHFVGVSPINTNLLLNLTVYPLGTPVISQPRVGPPGQFGFWVNGTNNVTYTVQVSTNLTDWSSIYSFELLTNSLFITDPAATNGHRFYRIVK
ncbi:MAG TPA: carboxypeptidase-like regulatory domain-containing protein [Verrucomicrobiae bacterium]|jgi:hypothetical protein|nr:carboxypeptidase-like regulatory domain-containing protein [Verrucomicrobiae bacterium]